MASHAWAALPALCPLGTRWSGDGEPAGWVYEVPACCWQLPKHFSFLHDPSWNPWQTQGEAIVGDHVRVQQTHSLPDNPSRPPDAGAPPSTQLLLPRNSEISHC